MFSLHLCLLGIKEKLPVIQETFNASAILLNSIYPSTNFDFGYDITDFKDVSAEYGTLAEFDALVELIHKKGMVDIFSTGCSIRAENPW